MSVETTNILADASRRLFGDICTTAALMSAEQHWSGEMWNLIAAAGYPLALLPETKGGIGVSLADGLAVVRSAGEFGLPLPLAETMLANWILSEVGITTPSGPIALSTPASDREVSLRSEAGRWRLTGIVRRVPGARYATHSVLCLRNGDRCQIAVFPIDTCDRRMDQNLACEARDDLHLDFELPSDNVAEVNLCDVQIRALGAAFRCSQMAGALDRVLEITVEYAKNRTQFGRSIGKFQAVQQNLAMLASHVAAAGAAANLAAEGVEDGPSVARIAVAKVRIGEAAGLAAAIAHQVHGAFGFTYEHNLHFFTKRLLSWREEFGNERYWSRWLGRRALEAGADALWPAIVAL